MAPYDISEADHIRTKGGLYLEQISSILMKMLTFCLNSSCKTTQLKPRHAAHLSGMPVLPPQVCAFTLMNYPALAHAQPALFLHQNQESSPRLRSHLVHRETSPDGTA